MLTVDRLSLQYQQQVVLRDISLQLTAGIHGLVGKSGSGKTSLLRCLAGLETYTGNIHGINRSQLGFIEQPMTLFPHLTVIQNIAYPLQLRKQANVAMTAQVATLMEQCQLTALAKRYPHEISGGEQRRVMLARSLVYQPQLLLCDEPFSALDALTRVTLVRWFKELMAQYQIIVLYVTHDIPEARFVAHDAIILDQGRIVTQGPWDHLRHPLLDVHF